MRPLPCKRSGQLESPSDLSPEVRSHLSEDAQRTFIANYNQSESGDESKAEHHAWDVVHEQLNKMKTALVEVQNDCLVAVAADETQLAE